MIPSRDKIHCDWCGINLSVGRLMSTKATLEMRQFDGGATRSSQEGKPELAGFTSPIATRRFGKYMMVHHVQEDGKLRKSDNWKSGMSRRAYVESLKRHFLDVEEIVTGDVVPGTDVSQARLEEALCAMFFNVQGLLREVMLEREIEEEN
jgi:hypothetical protein